MGQWVQWLRGEEGQGAMEYGVILALVALAVITALTLVGSEVNSIFTDVAGAL